MNMRCEHCGAMKVDGPIAVGDLVLRRADHQAEWKGHPIRFTPQEATVLSALVQNRGRTLSAEQLLVEMSTRGEAKIIQVVVCRIRQKFEEAVPGFREIETEWGVGYRWRGSSDTPRRALIGEPIVGGGPGRQRDARRARLANQVAAGASAGL